ncbi:MAG: flagellar hook-associated protein 3 [Chloroflexi bacterium]|nr:flagellar hook-associated protein 3 [Chloroflexota bacterium]
MRITDRMISDDTMANVARNKERLAELQAQASSGKRIIDPHDDPAGAGQVLSLRTSLAANETYLRNIHSSKEWLSATESALQNVVTVLQRALSNARQDASDNERATLASHVDGLIDDALTQFNARYRDAYLFAGFQTNTQPFVTVGSPVTAVNMAGAPPASNGVRTVEMERGQTVAVNVVNDAAGQFGAFASNVFNALITLRDDLNANNVNAIGADIATLQTALDGVTAVIGDIGARQQRLTDARTRLERVQLGLRDFLNRTEDANLAETIMHLSEQDTVYKASLRAAAQIGRTNLFDFLR